MPFFLQKEFLTERRRLLSSRAGKLPSSRLTISPWLRAAALELFPGGWDAQPPPAEGGWVLLRGLGVSPVGGLC